MLAFRPLSVYDVLVCQALLVAPGLPEVSVKRYSTGPVASEAVVAVMLMAVALSADGAEENVAGFGVGESVSASVVADAPAEAVPVLPSASRLVTV